MNDEQTGVAPDEPGAPAEKRSVSEWAQELGYVAGVRNPGLAGQVLFRGPHAGAAVLHGWDHFAYHNGGPFQCTRNDYEAAIAAALTTNDQGRAVPHPAADCRS